MGVGGAPAKAAAPTGTLPKAVEALVLQATSELLSTPDWSLNVNLSDLLNAEPIQYVASRFIYLGFSFLFDSGDLVAKTLKKRLKEKNNTIALNALTLLDSLVKSCPQFHRCVGTSDFMESFVKTLPEKVRDPQKKSMFKVADTADVSALERVDRTLLLIQTWGKAFAASKSYPAFRECYNSLVSKGVKFPEPLKDELAPVFTPAATASPAKKPTAAAASSAAAAPKPVSYRDAECRAAAENATVLADMVTASADNAELARNELVAVLLQVVTAAHESALRRLTGQESMTLAPDVMTELLRCNDFLSETLIYVQGVMSGKVARRARVTAAPAAAAPASAAAGGSSGGAGGGAGAATSQSHDRKEEKRAPAAPVALAPPPADAPASAVPAKKPASAAPLDLDFFSSPPAAAPVSAASAAVAPAAAAAPASAVPAAAAAGSAAGSKPVQLIKLAPPPATSSPATKPRVAPASGSGSKPAAAGAPAAAPLPVLDLLFSDGGAAAPAGAATGAAAPAAVFATPQKPASAPRAAASPFDMLGSAHAATPFDIHASAAPVSPAVFGFPAAVGGGGVAAAGSGGSGGGGGSFDDDFDPFSTLATRAPAAQPASQPAATAHPADDDDDPFAKLAMRR